MELLSSESSEPGSRWKRGIWWGLGTSAASSVSEVEEWPPLKKRPFSLISQRPRPAVDFRLME